MENKLHVVDLAEQAGGGCCVPSVKMVLKSFFEDNMFFNYFYIEDGCLYIKDDVLFEGIDVTMIDGNIVVSSEDETVTISLNSEGQLVLGRADSETVVYTAGDNISISEENEISAIIPDVTSVTGDTLPIGSQIPYGNAVAPSNWLICDGDAVSRLEYAELFAVIGTSYGVGDGSTTFNLPDKRKRTSVGLDTSDTDFNAIGKKLGEKEHTLTTDELPSNIGTFRALAWGGGSDNTTGMFSKEILANDRWADPGTDFGTRKYSLSGGNQPHNNMQPSEVDNWIIKAKQSAGMVATVVDNLTSISETDALSAKQGKVLKDLINEIKLEMKPIGSLEFNTSGDNPSTYLGGTWIAWGSGRVPVGVDTSQTEFNAVEKTGGEKTHTLTIAEIPRNIINITKNTSGGAADGYIMTGDYTICNDRNIGGANLPHNNLQPYVTCYMWKRTA